MRRNSGDAAIERGFAFAMIEGEKVGEPTLVELFGHVGQRQQIRQMRGEGHEALADVIKQGPAAQIVASQRQRGAVLIPMRESEFTQ